MSSVDVATALRGQFWKARDKAGAMRQAFEHSLRSGADREKQRLAAEAAEARAADLLEAVTALEIFLEDVDAVIRDLPPGSVRRRLSSARSRIGATP